MWNIHPASKIIEQICRRKSYSKHKKNLRSMKGLMHIQSPQKPTFVTSNPKQQMIRRDRLMQIDHHNSILNDKLIGVKVAVDHESKMGRKMQEMRKMSIIKASETAFNIEKENQKICMKLLNVQSFYPTTKIVQYTTRLGQVKHNISQNARRSLSMKSLKLRPNSAYNSSTNLYKSKVSKYDQQGNLTGEKLSVLYKLGQSGKQRPSTAPSNRYRSQGRVPFEKGNHNYDQNQEKNPIMKKGQYFTAHPQTQNHQQ